MEIDVAGCVPVGSFIKHAVLNYIGLSPFLLLLIFNHFCLQEDLSLTASSLSDRSQECLMAVYGGIELAPWSAAYRRLMIQWV